jgi:transposase
MRPTKELFRLWSRCRDGTLARRGFERRMQPIRKEIESLLLRGHGTAANGMCRELHKHRVWLWTFVEIEGIEPTNNASERALRPAVIWRKLSFGTPSASGSRFVETILTVIETCHRQSRPSFDYLTAALEAHFAAQKTPSLLSGV